MKERLLEVLKKEYPNIDFEGSEELVDDGVLDSLTITGIIALFTLEFGVSLPYEEIIPENFNSVDAMAEMLEAYI